MSEALRAEAGSLLAAWPDMLDPNFMHSVVVVCQHSTSGAYGLVTNRRTDLVVRDLFSEHPLLGQSDFPVHLGGPVDHSTLQFLHTVPDEIPGGVPLDDGLWLGGELESLGRFLATDADRASAGLRIFLGYSGWGAGQLDAELNAGAWVLAPPSNQGVFGPDGEPTWRRVVRSIGEAGAELENHPPDVSWN